ncbi:MAG: hypothetical protein GY834_05340, partial [Bacteroidetes bacterium]|nr:hypothetical protein [Bacteroidota bacterium]
TAMSQIMKFHEHPNSYNWDNMPDSWGTMETARLMRDVADAVSMDWSCDESGAKMSDAASAFSREFGYQNTSYSGFNSETVKQQIRWNRPAILSGYKEKSCFLLWCSYKKGHAWVCDGYRSSTIYSEDCSMGWGYLYLHMNWGWGDSESNRRLNGWYAYNNWNPGDTPYNHKKEMIYNIKP